MKWYLISFEVSVAFKVSNTRNYSAISTKPSYMTFIYFDFFNTNKYFFSKNLSMCHLRQITHECKSEENSRQCLYIFFKTITSKLVYDCQRIIWISIVIKQSKSKSCGRWTTNHQKYRSVGYNTNAITS